MGAVVASRLWRDPPRTAGHPGGSFAISRWADGRPVLVVGRVVGNPDGRAKGDQFLFDARWMKRGFTPATPVVGRVAVFRFSPRTALVWGDEAALWGLLSLPRTAAAPGTFNARSYDASRGVHARLFVPKEKSWLIRRASPWNPFRWAGALRDQMGRVFAARLKPRAAAVLSGLVLGRRVAGFGDIADDFRRSGTAHLLVASGSNVGFALGLWWFAARWVLFWPRRWVWAAAPFWAFLYAGVAGGEPPVVRAALMASAGAAGRLLGRWDRPEQPLFLSAGILLTLNPGVVFNPGFQLSYAATLGIATFWPRWESLWSAPHGPLALWGIGRAGFRLLGMSLAAQLALAPLLLFHFGRFSIAGLLANLLAVPLAGLGLGLGVGLFVFHELGLGFLASGTAAVAEKAVECLLGWAGFCGRWPWAEVRADLTPVQAAALGGFVVAVFVLISFPPKRWWWLFPLGFAAGAVLFWGGRRPDAPALRIAWFGREGAVVRTSAGATWLDFGEDEIQPLWVSEFLRGQGVRRLRRWIRCGPAAPPPGFDIPITEILDASKDGPDEDVWREGGVRWTVVHPGVGSEGTAVLLEHGRERALIGLSPSEKGAAALARRVPGNIDVLGWRPRTGSPRVAEALGGWNFRHLVFLGRRASPALLRNTGSAGFYRPSRGAVAWSAESGGGRLSLLAEETPSVMTTGVW